MMEMAQGTSVGLCGACRASVASSHRAHRLLPVPVQLDLRGLANRGFTVPECCTAVPPDGVRPAAPDLPAGSAGPDLELRTLAGRPTGVRREVQPPVPLGGCGG